VKLRTFMWAIAVVVVGGLILAYAERQLFAVGRFRMP
jgi:hypothetical protein